MTDATADLELDALFIANAAAAAVRGATHVGADDELDAAEDVAVTIHPP